MAKSFKPVAKAGVTKVSKGDSVGRSGGKKAPAGVTPETPKKPTKKADVPATKPATKPSSKSTAKGSAKPGSTSAAKATTKTTEARPAQTATEAVRGPVKKAQASEPGPSPVATEAVSADAAGGDDRKTGRKGITIVSKRPARKTKSKPERRAFTPVADRLLGPGSPVRKPLIPSGPSVSSSSLSGRLDPSSPRKSPFKKRELDRYRRLLIGKRAELQGDMVQMESDALRSESGDLSHLPQHMADQGSDSYEQSLSLDLAAADRRLIKEIDAALKRLDDGVYGLCEQTGRPIGLARLEELPWARFSIEAAREIERRGGG